MRRWMLALGAFLGGAAIGAGTLVPLLRGRAAPRAIAGDLAAAARVLEKRGDGRPAPIVCWGDSLTGGTGAAPGHDFPSLLGFLFERRAENRGVAGETSRQIAARMLSRPASEASENAVIWAGRNDDLSDVAAVEANIDRMVASLPAASRYLVLAVLNSDTRRERRGGDRYAEIVALNDHLRRRYGNSFLPIRDILVAWGRTGDGDDRDAAEADVVPPSLRSDPLHLNARGQAVVAYAVEEAMRADGW